ncbi:hypothetical protein MPTK1_5g03830 [Marchantia polymorpha subsp. ruderalis]|uniref:Uncharacterized protein n=2 Tax=Marchantia polymorpha TaxID=3197 RepID=A0AAF6BEN9_MARPO|nr:hypothetical protein MARPO_0133s0006 [Marchantia polymorpha]BBN10473.1 hypothetical protein Mp_5g03830 [Marchantia polymorpha subsp. ruderalis]|eukprot:PTQ29853.1 hypothetical protein MARPO_0133s0006 [Marchantia polymorpha]
MLNWTRGSRGTTTSRFTPPLPISRLSFFGSEKRRLLVCASLRSPAPLERAPLDVAMRRKDVRNVSQKDRQSYWTSTLISQSYGTGHGYTAQSTSVLMMLLPFPANPKVVSPRESGA